jgi:hypothetical protein
MSELRDLWEAYKIIEVSGQGRNDRASEIEAKIHEIQKGMGSSPYDFDKRWEKNEAMKTESVTGPPDFNSKPASETQKVPQGHFSVDEAKEIIGANDLAILDDCAKHAEAEEIYLEHQLSKINPANRNNHARRGMVGNRAMQKFERRKA